MAGEIFPAIFCCANEYVNSWLEIKCNNITKAELDEWFAIRLSGCDGFERVIARNNRECGESLRV
jgi:hypothetical protein